jgi:hypothetical protein
MTVEVRSDGHGKAAKAPPIALKFHSTKIWIVKCQNRRNPQPLSGVRFAWAMECIRV